MGNGSFPCYLTGLAALCSAVAPLAAAPPADTTCGHRCVVRVLNKYCQSKCDLYELVNRFPPRDDGTSVSELADMLRVSGVPSVPVAVPPDGWLDCDMPFIALLLRNESSLGHFVVVEPVPGEPGRSVIYDDGAVYPLDSSEVFDFCEPIVVVVGASTVDEVEPYSRLTVFGQAKRSVAVLLCGVVICGVAVKIRALRRPANAARGVAEQNLLAQ